MGMYDCIYVECPDCGREIEFQSKAGECSCTSYTIHDVPPEIAGDINGKYAQCNCGKSVQLKVLTIVTVV